MEAGDPKEERGQRTQPRACQPLADLVQGDDREEAADGGDEAQRELELSLHAARELGHARLLSIVQCNLGLVAEALGRPDAAGAYYEAALRLARDLGDRRSQGQFLGYAGLLHARQGRDHDARECLSAGETLLRSMSDWHSLGILLCASAEAYHRAGDLRAAVAALADARAIASDLESVPAESELGRALQGASDLVVSA